MTEKPPAKAAPTRTAANPAQGKAAAAAAPLPSQGKAEMAPKAPRKAQSKTQPKTAAETEVTALAPTPRKAPPKTPAESACERLVIYIRQFESQLDQSQEIAMGFTGGAAGVLRIEGLGWSAPDLLTFFGQDEDGMRTQMVQHVSQLSVMLRAVPKLAPEAPPVRIGFRLVKGWGGGESGDASVWPVAGG